MSETQEELIPVPEDATDEQEELAPVPFDDDTEVFDTPEEDWDLEGDPVDPEEAEKAVG